MKKMNKKSSKSLSKGSARATNYASTSSSFGKKGKAVTSGKEKRKVRY